MEKQKDNFGLWKNRRTILAHGKTEGQFWLMEKQKGRLTHPAGDELYPAAEGDDVLVGGDGEKEVPHGRGVSRQADSYALKFDWWLGNEPIMRAAGHLRYFLIFSIIDDYFSSFFVKLIWLGVGFLNRTGAEIGC